MATETKIQWCDHTFNHIRGCQIPRLDDKPSPECVRCYAMRGAKRNPGVLGVWGSVESGGTRVLASEAMWKTPLTWQAAAGAAGERRRVFCASIADVFEDWQGRLIDSKGNDAGTIHAARARLFHTIINTPHLDWLLLTKRPENIISTIQNVHDLYSPQLRVPDAHAVGMLCGDWLMGRPPANVRVGTTAGTQRSLDVRGPQILAVPAAIHFLSVEPLLEPLCLKPQHPHASQPYLGGPDGINWVIVGGESGPNARPMNPDWARSIRDQCQESDVAFFMKQMGGVRDKRGELDDIPEDLRIREFPR